MSNNINYTKLSKEVSYALRHAPWDYELKPDKNGWVAIEKILQAFQQSKEWQNVELDDFKMMIERSEKKGMRLKKMIFEHYMDILLQ